MADTNFSISSFGEDQSGTIFAVDHDGDVWRIIADPA